MEAYKQGSDEWRKAIGKAAATRQEFAALFGSGSQPAPATSAHPPSTHPADDADGSEDEEDKPLSASSPDAAKPSHSSLGGAANGIAADKGGTKRKRIKSSDPTLAADLTPSSGPAAVDGSAQGVGTNARHGRGETQAGAEGTGYGDGEKLVRRKARGKGAAERQKAAKKARKAAKAAAAASEAVEPAATEVGDGQKAGKKARKAATAAAPINDPMPSAADAVDDELKAARRARKAAKAAGVSSALPAPSVASAGDVEPPCEDALQPSKKRKVTTKLQVSAATTAADSAANGKKKITLKRVSGPPTGAIQDAGSTETAAASTAANGKDKKKPNFKGLLPPEGGGTAHWHARRAASQEQPGAATLDGVSAAKGSSKKKIRVGTTQQLTGSASMAANDGPGIPASVGLLQVIEDRTPARTKPVLAE